MALCPFSIKGKAMLNTFSNTQQALILAGVVIVVAYVAFLVIGFAHYHKSRKRPSKKAGKQISTRVTTYRASTARYNPNQVLPNGYRRKDYHRYGYSDSDIEFLGLDQPSAPDPFFSGWVMADMAGGDLDGEIDFF